MSRNWSHHHSLCRSRGEALLGDMVKHGYIKEHEDVRDCATVYTVPAKHKKSIANELRYLALGALNMANAIDKSLLEDEFGHEEPTNTDFEIAFW